MIKRDLENKLRSALEENSSVALMGPRQVGKTTLALDIADTIPSVYAACFTQSGLLRGSTPCAAADALDGD